MKINDHTSGGKRRKYSTSKCRVYPFWFAAKWAGIALVMLCLCACETAAPKTHHTALVAAPSAAPVTVEIKKAQVANDEARKITDKMDGKTILVLKWLQRHRQ